MSRWSLIPEWSGDASCAQVGSDYWYPDRGSSGREARAICATCPVREQCLQWALDNGEAFGIWGGKSERERRALGKKRRCKGCDKPFAPARPEERMCSDECRKAARLKTAQPNLRCVQCGAPSSALRCPGCLHRHQVNQVMTRQQTREAAA